MFFIPRETQAAGSSTFKSQSPDNADRSTPLASIRSRENLMSRKVCNNNRGFSLLEVIVALAIMGIAFITVLRLFSEGIRTLDYTEQYLKGITLANTKIGELELADFNVNVFYGDFENESRYRWELTLLPYDTILNNDLDRIYLMQADLKVLWNDMGVERQVELVTLKTLGKSYSAMDSVIAGTNKQGRDNPKPTGVAPPATGSPGSPNPSGRQ